MAQANQTTDSSDIDNDENIDAMVLPSPIVLEASGPATRSLHRDTATFDAVMHNDIEVEIEIEYEAIEDVLALLFKQGVSGLTVQNSARHAPKQLLKIDLDDALERMNCKVGFDQYDEWDITLDGSVTSWLAVFDHGDIGADEVSKLTDHDVFGHGLELAEGELRRRE